MHCILPIFPFHRPFFACYSRALLILVKCKIRRKQNAMPSNMMCSRVPCTHLIIINTISLNHNSNFSASSWLFTIINAFIFKVFMISTLLSFTSSFYVFICCICLFNKFKSIRLYFFFLVFVRMFLSWSFFAIARTNSYIE